MMQWEERGVKSINECQYEIRRGKIQSQYLLRTARERAEK